MSKTGSPGTRVNPGVFVCTMCREDDHLNCLDMKRASVGFREKLCGCTKHKAKKGTQ